MLFKHYTHVPKNVMMGFPNFSFEGDPKLYCPLTGEFFYDYTTLSNLQRYRFYSDKPTRINSGHRSPLHNSRVGGVPLSAHLALAVDINLVGRDFVEEYEHLKRAGFSSFGFYNTFIHVDMRPGRHWFGSISAKKHWQSLKGFEFSKV